MGNVIWIIISVILVIFIALSIISMATGKKRNESLEEKYNNIFAPLMDRVREKNVMGDDSLVVKILTDTEDGVLAVRDDKKNSVPWHTVTKLLFFLSSIISHAPSSVTVILSSTFL